jgi:hypothetical protein
MFDKIEAMGKDMRSQMERHQQEKMRRFDFLKNLWARMTLEIKIEIIWT